MNSESRLLDVEYLQSRALMTNYHYGAGCITSRLVGCEEKGASFTKDASRRKSFAKRDSRFPNSYKVVFFAMRVAGACLSQYIGR